VSERTPGKVDFIAETPECDWVIRLENPLANCPKMVRYSEHRLQLAAYAKSWV